MWMECSPGGRFLISSVIFTPFAAGANTAVPTNWPWTFLISTVTALGAAWERASGAKIPPPESNSAAQRKTLMQIHLAGKYFFVLRILSKNVPSQSSAGAPESNNVFPKEYVSEHK